MPLDMEFHSCADIRATGGIAAPLFGSTRRRLQKTCWKDYEILALLADAA